MFHIKDGYPADSVLLTRPVIYDNECSCALNQSCTTEAFFINNDSSSTVPITGFKMGCTPTESFLLSTLECFYDLSCIHSIQENTNNINMNTDANASMIRLSKSNYFAMNTTIFDLIQDLFVESWSSTTNYSAYFHRCSPISCSYTYVQQLNSFYTVSLLLRLYGGFSFAYTWICPYLVYLLARLYHWRKKRLNVVQPRDDAGIAFIKTTDTTLISTNQFNTTTSLESTSTTSTSKYILFLFILNVVYYFFLQL